MCFFPTCGPFWSLPLIIGSYNLRHPRKDHVPHTPPNNMHPKLRVGVLFSDPKKRRIDFGNLAITGPKYVHSVLHVRVLPSFFLFSRYVPHGFKMGNQDPLGHVPQQMSIPARRAQGYQAWA